MAVKDFIEEGLVAGELIMLVSLDVKESLILLVGLAF